ncbi:hypothetical protein D187_007474 [Cystobacter fuscus DSM 2262]|uniref:Uncharacterized protein n=1 Tax=Cystobacter fuscus (strain ATCC 25194 / DSM 2262 / NBRC 100088 / M29) TaxID=1242864 RepID=S9P1L6_CYSF2|nr:hypothetical protein D187_007474 [Cystobacter fuscus DSM 2262]
MPLQTKEGMYPCTKWMDATLRAMTLERGTGGASRPCPLARSTRVVKARCVIVQSHASPGGSARGRMNAR